MHRSESGQSTVEYVGLLALLAVLVTLAAVAVAAPELPKTVVAKMRLALCIVGGDVCSPSDAAAQGLDPCVTDAESHTEQHGATIGFLHPNKGGSYRIERLSDGRVRISRAKDLGLDGTIGAEIKAGPIKAGGSASLGVVFTPGKQWVMSAADYDRLVAASGVDDSDYGRFDDVLDHQFPRPTSEFKEFGVRSEASVTAKLALKRGEYGLGSYGNSSERALGFRDDPDGTSTVYFRVGTDVTGPLAGLLPAAARSTLLAEWRTSDPPRLTLHVAEPAPSAGQSEEVMMSLDLDTPELRTQALRAMLASPVASGLAFQGMAGAIRSQGTVERFRYADHGSSASHDYGVALGPGIGYDKQTSAAYRRLIDAEVLKDGVPIKREDCLGTIVGA